jgi:hypothetical protein
VEAWGLALRNSREAFRAYSDACMARDETSSRRLDAERDRLASVEREAMLRVRRLLENGPLEGYPLPLK